MSREAIPYLDCGIEPGDFTVIEAAAGTGKTHNITRIVARLIMERQDLTVENMAVVTFTRAAAAELKARISGKLAELEKNLIREECDDELIRAALKKAAPAAVKKRLRHALLNFDRASIGTIHSFAMRVLTENGFGSKLKFGFTLRTDTAQIIADLCEDYFRSLFYREDNDAVRKLLLEKCALSSGKISKFVSDRLSSPGIRVVYPDVQEFPDVDSAIAASLKPPRGQTARYLNGTIKAVCEEACSQVSAKFRRLCEENNFLSQDDQILKLRSALLENSLLRGNLRERFKVGLIDEFQDTNSAQFDIFRELFVENPESTFIVVGDPRQAIYRFRNCDLAAYMDAVKLLKQRGARAFPMNTNRRSGERYIEALNQIFTPRGSFAFGELDMPPQHALPGAPVLLDSSGAELAFPIQAACGAMPLKSIMQRCAADIAEMLSGGFQLPPRPESEDPADRVRRPLGYGDIAILINTSWANGYFLKSELLKRGVPATALRGENIFSSAEAGELACFLEGVLRCSDKDPLLRALITPLGDLEINQLGFEKEVERRAAWMRELKSLWEKRSFAVMFNEASRKFRTGMRLAAAGSEGEGALNKFNTLAAILGEMEFNGKLTPNALLRELFSCIENAAANRNEFPTPPETDKGAVIIDTVFGSKGLSYPAVFLPDLFYTGNSLNGDRICRCRRGGELCISPLQLPELRSAEQDEIVQESLRKAYVAFTRARYYCRFYCGLPLKEGFTAKRPLKFHSAADWLFRRGGCTEFSGLVRQMDSFTGELKFPAAVEKVEITPDGNPRRKEEKIPEEKRRRPDLLPELTFSRGFLSFSSLADINHASGSSFGSDKEDEPPIPGGDEGMREILSLRGGTSFGNAVHKLFEEADFAAGPGELAEKAAGVLGAFGFTDPDLGSRVGEMLHRVLNSPLPDGAGGFFTLSEVPPDKRKSEFEFLYQFSRAFTAEELFQAVNAYFSGAAHVPCAEFPLSNERFEQGFFNGAIDLFFEHGERFYIVDWKTNKLEGLSSYVGVPLAAAMGRSGYYLQYLIYTAALFKYLKQRLRIGADEEESFYRERFGGVRYLFVRGMTPELPGSGVFGDAPPYEFYKQLEGIIG